jgi:hypothetical protein
MQEYLQKVRTSLVASSLSLVPVTNIRSPINEQNKKLAAPAGHHNTSGQFAPSIHGSHGAVDVSLAGFPYPPRYTCHSFYAGDRRVSIQSGYEQRPGGGV